MPSWEHPGVRRACHRAYGGPTRALSVLDRTGARHANRPRGPMPLSRLLTAYADELLPSQKATIEGACTELCSRAD